MLIHQMKESIRNDMSNLQIQVDDADVNDAGVFTVKAHNISDGKKMNLRVNHAQISNWDFDFTHSFVADLFVSSVKTIYGTSVLVCPEVKIVSAGGETVEILEGL